jgi:hypothetical protein
MVQGIMLNIDNNMLTQCQAIAEAKMLEICGDTGTCGVFNNDDSIGISSLESIKNTSTGDWEITGLVSYGEVELLKEKVENEEDGSIRTEYIIDVNKYLASLPSDVDESVRTRIQGALKAISNTLKRNTDIISSDAKIEMCVSGRDMSQISGARRGQRNSRSKGRFPNLLDSYAKVIAESALDTAKINYDFKYAELFATANSASADYQNQLYCNAMVNGSGGSRSAIEEAGVRSINKWRIVISDVTTSQMMTAVSASSEKEEVVLDTKGAMIAKRSIKSVYEKGSKICRITTTTSPCTGFEAIYNTHSTTKSGGGSFGIGGVSVGASGSKTTSSTTYQGNFCATYAEPVISEQLINLGNGSGGSQFANTSRSNLQSNYISNSSSVVDNSRSGGGGVGVSVGLDVGNIIGNVGSLLKKKETAPAKTETSNTRDPNGANGGGGGKGK